MLKPEIVESLRKYDLELDEWGHDFFKEYPDVTAREFFCWLLDISCGWGPSASGWEESPTWVKKLYAEIWQGVCHICGGQGTIPVSLKRKESGEIHERIGCEYCDDGKIRL